MTHHCLLGTAGKASSCSRLQCTIYVCRCVWVCGDVRGSRYMHALSILHVQYSITMHTVVAYLTFGWIQTILYQEIIS